MAFPINQNIATRLDEMSALLAAQGANRFRVEAYRRAATTVRQLTEPVSALLARDGLPGLERLPGIGASLARTIHDLARHGRSPALERLRGRHDPVALLRSVPGIGRLFAVRLHEQLGLETLAELEAAAHDGRLAAFEGIGPKRLAGIRDSLAQRLGRIRPPPSTAAAPPPTVAELLDVDREYRQGAAAGTLPRIAPRRFNPTGAAWLPILHTQRGDRHYTALYSNTAHAHALERTHDWVVLFHDSGQGERQHTVVTARFGPLAGRRIVRGREPECAAHYDSPGDAAPAPEVAPAPLDHAAAVS